MAILLEVAVALPPTILEFTVGTFFAGCNPSPSSSSKSLGQNATTSGCLGAVGDVAVEGALEVALEEGAVEVALEGALEAAAELALEAAAEGALEAAAELALEVALEVALEFVRVVTALAVALPVCEPYRACMTLPPPFSIQLKTLLVLDLPALARSAASAILGTRGSALPPTLLACSALSFLIRASSVIRICSIRSA